MKIAEEYLLALRVVGYTDCEARFLYLAATHSGYFVPRQFNTFADVNWGNRLDPFTRKLEARGHAKWREYLGIGSVYHLCAKDVYTRIGKEDLRYHRVHSIEFIITRLVHLDFIIANQEYDYLETENQKLSYFSEALGIPTPYLRLRARRDQEQNGSLSHDEIAWLEQASRRFESGETERLYVSWLTGEVSEDALPRQLAATLGPRCVAFSQRLVSCSQTTAEGNRRQW
jgi:hypothetical protein